MIYKEFRINEEGSNEDTKLSVYIQQPSDSLKITKRPMVLICPGGAYAYTSDREAEPIAFAFMGRGFNVAILRYSCYPAHFPASLLEVGRSIIIIREHAKEWEIDPDAIVVQGCSAGGHLAASFGCFWKEDFISEKLFGTALAEEKEKLRPNGLILCYPVISGGEFAHRDSFKNLLGDRYDELLEKTSLENSVNKNVPRTFIWHTYTDGSVPVENSYLFAMALKRCNINTELHVFPEGGHGLSMSNWLSEGKEGKENVPACEPWIELACTWMKYFLKNEDE